MLEQKHLLLNTETIFSQAFNEKINKMKSYYA